MDEDELNRRVEKHSKKNDGECCISLHRENVDEQTRDCHIQA